ncbi:PREDICTED: uncharacterized protein LOC106811593 isoform X2 [Priapulus caudatus]|uniref:Uncharacterized protein LOC106811593 isoform X2 n=1 Tax=Priapulus caudatus TaxID=37621 RepID=A0ABM1EF01_PRICU|nr:PREDICTED: uncharacterized protein LOC106811593 isoform X2 [Priapulus caudatus]
MPYWIHTEILVPFEEEVHTAAFQLRMEERLARAYHKALRKRTKRSRRVIGARFRRAAHYKETAVQMVNTVRHTGEQRVTLVYHVELQGKPVLAKDAVATMNRLDIQQLAIILGYVVVLLAEPFTVESEPERDEPQYWLIGVIVGAVVALAFIIWCSLFIYYKCLKPHPAEEPGQPHLVSIKNKRYYVQDIGIDNPARDVENQLVPRSPPQLRSRAHYDVSATPVLSGKIAKNYIDGVRLGLSEKEHIIDSAYDDAGTSGDTSSEHHETKPTATSEITHEVDKSEGENEEDWHTRAKT